MINFAQRGATFPATQEIAIASLEQLYTRWVRDSSLSTSGKFPYMLQQYHMFEERDSSDMIVGLKSSLPLDQWRLLIDTVTDESLIPVNKVLMSHMHRLELAEIQKIHMVFSESGMFDAETSELYDADLGMKFKRVTGSISAHYRIGVHSYAANCHIHDHMFEGKNMKHLEGFLKAATEYANEDKEMTSFQKLLQYTLQKCASMKLRKISCRLYEEIHIREVRRVTKKRHGVNCIECGSPEDLHHTFIPTGSQDKCSYLIAGEVCGHSSSAPFHTCLEFMEEPEDNDDNLICRHCGHIKSRHRVKPGQRRMDHAFSPKLELVRNGQIFRTCAWTPIDKEFDNAVVRNVIVRQTIGTSDEVKPMNANISSFIRAMTNYNDSPGQWKNITNSSQNAIKVEEHISKTPLDEVPLLRPADASWSFLNGIYIASPKKEWLLDEEILDGAGCFFPYKDIRNAHWTSIFCSSKFIPVWFDKALIHSQIRGSRMESNSRISKRSNEIDNVICCTCNKSCYRHDDNHCKDENRKRIDEKQALQRGDWINGSTLGSPQIPHAASYIDDVYPDGWYSIVRGKVSDRRWVAIDPIAIRVKCHADVTKNTHSFVRVDAPGSCICTKTICVGCKNVVCDCAQGCRNFILRKDSWYSIKTPCFQQILDYQYCDFKNNILKDSIYGTSVTEKDIICQVIYVMLGRMFFKMNRDETDRWQCVFMIKGQAASGKSTIGQLLQWYFDPSDVCTMSSNMQEKFGLATLVDPMTGQPKKLSMCLEVKKEFGKNVNQGDFQSIVSNETVTINRKNDSAIEISNWNRPLFLCGNETPGYADTSNSIGRRFILACFDRAVNDDIKDGALLDRIKQREGPALVYKCILAYKMWSSLHSRKTLTATDDITKVTILPQYFIDQQIKMRASSHTLLGFLLNNPICRTDDANPTGKCKGSRYLKHPSFYVKEDIFIKDLCKYCKEVIHKKEPTWEADYYHSVLENQHLKIQDCSRKSHDEMSPIDKGVHILGIGIEAQMIKDMDDEDTMSGGKHADCVIEEDEGYVMTRAEWDASQDIIMPKENKTVKWASITETVSTAISIPDTVTEELLSSIVPQVTNSRMADIIGPIRLWNLTQEYRARKNQSLEPVQSLLPIRQNYSYGLPKRRRLNIQPDSVLNFD